MAVVIIDGRVRVTFANSIANINLPTAAECNGGTALEGYITPDGLTITPTTAKVDTSSLGSKQTTNRAGRVDHDIKLKIHHDGTSDVGWNLLPYRTNGYLIVRRGIDRATVYAPGDKVAVYPVEAAEPDETDPAPNGTWDFEVGLFLTADSQTRAVVA
jgi:hypothetical protein